MAEMLRVYVPRETTALSLGAEAVAEAITRQAADRGLPLELIRNGSRGMCWLEPLVEADTDEGRIAFGPIETDDVPALLDALAADGAHPKALGPTERIPYLDNQERLTFARCGLDTATSVAAYRRLGGFDGLKAALAMSPKQVVDTIESSGLRGRGGAGFPTGIKWRTAAEATADRRYIACNADEGDSGTFSDRLIMECDPLSLIEGMTIAGHAVGASQGYIYLRSEYPLAAEILDEALAAARSEAWLGRNIAGSGFDFEIEVRIGAGSYICGEEMAMLESLEGRRGQVRQKPPLPAISGLFGKPTVINNVITLATVPVILARGADHYASFGQGRSRGTLPFQLSGNVRRGGLVEKAFGLTLGELIEDFGGGTASGRPLRAVQVGGPLGAYFPESLLDTPLDYEAFAERGGMLGHGGVVVFDDRVDMAVQARFAMEFCALESCGKCTPCRIGSVRGVEVIDRIRAGQDREANLHLLEELCETLEKGSLCGMGGLTPYPVRSAVRHFPDDFSGGR